MSFGKRLRQRRLELELSQEEVARALGKNQNTIAGYENGRFQSIKPSLLNDFARVLKCEPEWILGPDELTLKKYPEEIREWLSKDVAVDYVLEAFNKYLKERVSKF